jgi:hypothetical protein
VGYDAGMLPEHPEPNTPHKYRKLQIGWSVLSGVGVLLLIAIWIRSSTFQDDATQLCYDNMLRIISDRGNLHIYREPHSPGGPLESEWLFDSSRTEKLGPVTNGPLGFCFVIHSKSWFHFAIPYWLAAILVAGIGVAPWRRWNFSLRTMFVAVTIAAVFLESPFGFQTEALPAER